MKQAALPANEPARIRALRALNILDSGREAAFDAIVELASDICEMPIAAISLIDTDREWFKAAKGLDGVDEMPRAVSFCGHVVADGSSLTVADALADPRFVDNPLVTGAPDVRFYAGIPLLTGQGYVLGALCVVDRKAGSLSVKQRNALDHLATLVVQLMLARGADARRVEVEQHFEDMADSAPVMIWMSDAALKLNYGNRAWHEFTGRSIDAEIEMGWLDRVHPDDRPSLTDTFLQAIMRPGPFRVECRLCNQYQQYRWLIAEGKPRLDRNGTFVGYSGSCTDFTEHKETELALKLAEERMELIIAGSNDAPWDWDLEADEVYYSPRWWSMLGHDDGVLTGDSKLWQSLIHPDDRVTVKAAFDRAIEPGNTGYELEFRLRHKDGRFVPVLSRGYILRNSKGLPIRISGTNTDLTDRKQVDIARQQALSLLQKIASRVPGMVYQFRVRPDGSSCFPYASEAIRQIYRVAPEDVIDDAAPVFKNIHPDDLEAIAASIERSKVELSPWRHEYRVKFADGTVQWLFGNASPEREDDGSVLWHGFITDISAQKAAALDKASLESQLRESQKMEAIGTLAGGIAHDFNNIVGTILGNIELARQEVGGNSDVLQSLDEVRKAGERARDLVRQILSFSRRQPTMRRALALQPRVEAVIKMVRSTLLAPVSINCLYEPNIPNVLADATQVEQALLNLLTNATQAMHRKPGRIDVHVEAIEFAAPAAHLHGGLPAGRYARISVRDTGEGMDEATIKRIFEPFFTTKPVGTGTGLGLSVVYGIMQTHGGAVVASSDNQHGSNFALYFPATQESSMDTPERQSSLRQNDVGEGRRVLYIDDDEALILLVERMLKKRGYVVTGFSEAEEALETLRAKPMAFDLVVTDYNMPGMSGIDVATLVKGIRADLPVAIASGFITDEMRAEALSIGVKELIFKPNAIEEYCAAVDRFALYRE